MCRKCGLVLIEGVTWTAALAKRRDYICRACVNARHKPAKLKYSRTIHGAFTAARKRAYSAGRKWELTEEEYAALRARPCHYCGGPLGPVGCGLDQIRPGEGYAPGNVVPCCKDCNMAKSNVFSYDEMFVIGAAIRAVREGRKVDAAARAEQG